MKSGLEKLWNTNEPLEGDVMAEILVRVIRYIYHYKEDKLKFLILKRSETKIYEHLWQGVAGKIEKALHCMASSNKRIERRNRASTLQNVCR